MSGAPAPGQVPSSGNFHPPGHETLRILKGKASEEDIAALLVALTALEPVAPPSRPNHQRQWMRQYHLRLGPQPGPHAWRRSTWR